MRKIQFDDFELDLELYRLKRAGEPVSVGPRAMDLLIYLIKNRERVVGQNELREHVWKAAALSPSSIPTCVRELRLSLGDDAAKPTHIQTSRRRGYRFIGELTDVCLEEKRQRESLSALPFVGRSTQLTSLRFALERVKAETRCQLILVRGEAGIGKTRLLAEFVTGEPNGVPSYLSSTPEAKGVPAFWPWTQVLREALAHTTTENSELRNHARVLSTVFPEIQQDADTPFKRPASPDRHSILSQWARTIRSISPKQPFILAFDDVHRTDPDTLSLLYWISQELVGDPILVVATHRPTATSESTGEQLSKMAALSNCETIDLDPLDATDIARMLDPMMEHRDATGRALRHRTSGNAFYVTHLIRHLGRCDLDETAEKAIDKLPLNAEDIVANQLSDLPQETRRALSVASVSGRRFTVESLSAILRTTRHSILKSLGPAIRGWFIVENGADYEFAHSLLRDALYQAIEPNDRKRLHLDFAHTLRDRSGSLSRWARIAEHLIAAQPLGDQREVWNFSLLAGRESAARFAYEKAQTFFKSALLINDNSTIATFREQCQLMLEYAEAQLYAGDRRGARETVIDALALAKNADLLELATECALQLSPDFLAIEYGVHDAVLVHHLDEALNLVPKEDKALTARLLARLSQALQWSNYHERSEQLAISSLQLARESADQLALSAALSARAETLHGPDRTEARIQALLELGEIQKTNPSIAQTLVQRTRLISALLELGEIKRVDSENEACRQLAVETGLPQLLWYPESMDEMRRIMSGTIDPQTKDLSRRFSEIREMGEDINVVQGFATQELFKLVERDQLGEAIAMIEPLANAYQAVRSWSAGEAWIHFLSGSLDEAQASIRRFDTDEISALFKEAGGGVGIALLAEVAANIGSREQIQDLFDRVRLISNRYAVAGYGVLYLGSYARYCGLLAGALGYADIAISYLENAVEHESTKQALGWKGYSEIDLALQLYKRDPRDSQISAVKQHAVETCRTVNTERLNRKLSEALETLSK